MAANVINRSRRVKRWAAGFALAAVASVGGMGFLHTQYGKPLLMKLGGCPVGNVSPQELDTLRAKSFANMPATDKIAPTEFALGFTLGSTTVKDVQAWASTHNLNCATSREDSVVSCGHVPSTALPSSDGTSDDITELSFGFHTSDKLLYSVTAWREDITPAAGSTAFNAISTTLRKNLGEPQVGGEPATPELLNGRLWSAALSSYNFKGYSASATATKQPSGVWLREVYTSTKPPDSTPKQGS